MKNDTKALGGIWGISLVVFAVVALLSRVPQAEQIPGWAVVLPGLNATLNGTCALLLIVSFCAIKRGRVALHKKLNLTAFALSSLFLISYVTFHAFGVETRYPAESPWRPLYLVILISHIILAAAVLPLVLISFYWALSGRIDRHRHIVKYSYPIWLYVTLSGVVVYLMIAPYYAF